MVIFEKVYFIKMMG